MSILIRPASAADAAALSEIEQASSAAPWPQSRLHAVCEGNPDPAPRALVACTDAAAPCAYLAYNLLLDEVTIQNIAVHPRARRGGVARALLQRALADWREAGASRCLLEVRVSNVAARSLYGAMGFTLDGVRKNYYPLDDGREDALLMSRLLHEAAPVTEIDA